MSDAVPVPAGPKHMPFARKVSALRLLAELVAKNTEQPAEEPAEKEAA